MEKMTQTGIILKHLKKHGKMTNVEMWNRRIQRGSERIRELKAEGHIIVTNHIKGPLWEYVYMGHPDDKTKKWWRMRDLYNCNTYILSWVEPSGEPKSKAYETRNDARQMKAKLKKRLGKKWHGHIEIKKIVTAEGFIEETSVVR